ncbi:MAG: porin family protein [Neomegalonema sp.]|nr:porin family protein [Neomegalonema sp.]
MTRAVLGRRLSAIAGGALLAATALMPAAAQENNWATQVFVGGDIVLGHIKADSSNASGNFAWGVTGVAGVELANHIALMGELQFRQAEISDTGNDRDFDIYTGFVTAHYRIPLAGSTRPYVGAGAGYSIATADGQTDHGFAAKLVAGADFALTDTSSTYFEYNFVRMFMSADEGADYNADDHQVRAGVRWRF